MASMVFWGFCEDVDCGDVFVWCTVWISLEFSLIGLVEGGAVSSGYVLLRPSWMVLRFSTRLRPTKPFAPVIRQYEETP